MKKKKEVITIQGIDVSILSAGKEDYICLTDMAKAKGEEFRAADIIKNWIRNRITLEFLGTWEIMYNTNFKVVEFDHFKMQAGLPSFVLSVSQWIEKTSAIGMYVKNGRYGGTYAHKDIAFEFGSAISPVFKLYLIKEYQRLKETEVQNQTLEWDVRRLLSKANYHIHTDAIKKYIIPHIPENLDGLQYASEADLLNMVLWNCTAKQWREANPDLCKNGQNIRDYATINELVVLSNLETHNAELIKLSVNKQERYLKLKEIAGYQLNVLNQADSLNSLARNSDLNE